MKLPRILFPLFRIRFYVFLHSQRRISNQKEIFAITQLFPSLWHFSTLRPMLFVDHDVLDICTFVGFKWIWSKFCSLNCCLDVKIILCRLYECLSEAKHCIRAHLELFLRICLAVYYYILNLSYYKFKLYIGNEER